MKSTAESPVKLPFKSDFTVKFECNSRYVRSFETKAATPKGPFRVRFPAGVPQKRTGKSLSFFVVLQVQANAGEEERKLQKGQASRLLFGHEVP